MTDDTDGKPPFYGLDALAQLVPANRPAPVERWNPPYCGDAGLEIRADGTWFHQGRPIPRPALVRLFASVLRKDDDGKTYLVTPAEKVDVQVADAPFLAVELRAAGEGEGQDLHLRTNLDDWVRIDEAHPLRFAAEATGGLKPYVTVRGRLEARLVRPVYFELAGLVVSRAEQPGVWSGGLWWPFQGDDRADT